MAASLTPIRARRVGCSCEPLSGCQHAASIFQVSVVHVVLTGNQVLDDAAVDDSINRFNLTNAGLTCAVAAKPEHHFHGLIGVGRIGLVLNQDEKADQVATRKITAFERRHNVVVHAYRAIVISTDTSLMVVAVGS